MDQAQKNTGLSDEQLNRFVALYDGNKGDDQFLSELMPADAAKIELMQPRYTSAQAMLILDGNDKFYRQIPTPLSLRPRRQQYRVQPVADRGRRHTV